MKKLKNLNIIPIIVVLMYALPLQAQINATLFYTDHFDMQASRYMPSKLGTGTANVNISIPALSANVWLGNNFTNYTKLLDVKEGKLPINTWVGKFPKNANIGFGTYVDAFSLSIRFNKKNAKPPLFNPLKDSLLMELPDTRSNDTEVLDTLQTTPPVKRHRNYKPQKAENFTITAGVTARAEGNLSISKQLFELIANGNAGFVGKTVDVGRFRLNLLSHIETHLGFAKNIIDREDMQVRLGVRLRYILGLTSLYTERASAKLTVSPDTSQFKIASNFRINTNMAERNDFNTNQSGRGIGMDLGTTITLANHVSFTASLLDIGAVNYSQNVKNYNGSGDATFEGVNISSRGIQNAGNLLDSLAKSFQSSETYQSYRMPLPTRFLLQAEYKIPAETKKGRKYYKHHFFATLVQGFRNIGSATTTPQLTLAYTHSLGTAFQVGVAPTFGGFAGADIGTFFSWRVSALRLALGTGGLINLATLGNGRLVDVSFNLGLGF